MKRSFRSAMMTVLLAAIGSVTPFAWQNDLQACPGCKNANETDSLRPKAYMYSILFMLGMPATVFTGFGIAFYRMSRRETLTQQQALEQQTNSENA